MPDIFSDRPAPAVSTWLARHVPANRKLVLMHAGSSKRWHSKRWEEAHFIELAGQLEALGFQVAWVGGADDRELNKRLSKGVVLGKQASFAICSDSGPMHLLSLSGIPVYAFFGPTDWQRSHAIGQQAHVLTNPVPCSPCHLGVCPPEHRHECLADISPDMIIARLQSDKLV
jgi:ADP-heptose:LPS heptosyltransferase